MACSIQELDALHSLLVDEQKDVIKNDKPSLGITPASFGPKKTSSQSMQPSAAVSTVVASQKSAIWDEGDISPDVANQDNRPAPEYEVLYKQAIGAEDVFLGMGMRDPSTASCESLLVKVFLPSTQMKDVNLVVSPDKVSVQSPQFNLQLPLPRRVDDKMGKAQWDRVKGLLSISLPILRDDI